jgi:integrase/recombinase XerC
LLASPRPHRTLPAVLGQDEAARMMAASASARADPKRETTRDAALVLRDCLIASCSTPPESAWPNWSVSTPRDLDRRQRLLRVLGKGSKERSVPYGIPADRALQAWLDHGRPVLRTETAGPRSCWAHAAPASTRALCAESCTDWRGGAGRARPGPARA